MKKKARRNVELDRAIGLRVREARDRKKMTQVDLGRLLGRESPTSMWKYELGQASIRTSDLAIIAGALDVSMDWLVFGKERVGLDPIIDDEARAVLLDQYNATDEERAKFEAHFRAYTHHRITATYVVALLNGLRMNRGDVAKATDAAVQAESRDVGIVERQGRAAKPDSLRRKKPKR